MPLFSNMIFLFHKAFLKDVIYCMNFNMFNQTKMSIPDVLLLKLATSIKMSMILTVFKKSKRKYVNSQNIYFLNTTSSSSCCYQILKSEATLPLLEHSVIDHQFKMASYTRTKFTKQWQVSKKNISFIQKFLSCTMLHCI